MNDACDEQIVMVLTFRVMVKHVQESGLLHSSHLGIARVTCATLYLYYMMIEVQLSLWTDFCSINGTLVLPTN